MKLEEAIKQQNFSSLELRTLLNLYHTHSTLQASSNAVLKVFQISVQQYNILRILRGQGGGPVNVSDITERMLDKMSNTSRLIEKLKQKGLVIRKECPLDRRRVEVELTPDGLKTVNAASEEMDKEIDHLVKEVN